VIAPVPDVKVPDARYAGGAANAAFWENEKTAITKNMAKNFPGEIRDRLRFSITDLAKFT
jgi:hypothetical protein